MRNGAKCTDWVRLGCLGATQGQGNVTIRWSAYDFLLDFNRNCASILYRFQDIATHLHLAPAQGFTPVEFCGDLWRQKTRVPGLSSDVCV